MGSLLHCGFIGVGLNEGSFSLRLSHDPKPGAPKGREFHFPCLLPVPLLEQSFQAGAKRKESARHRCGSPPCEESKGLAAGTRHIGSPADGDGRGRGQSRERGEAYSQTSNSPLHSLRVVTSPFLWASWRHSSGAGSTARDGERLGGSATQSVGPGCPPPKLPLGAPLVSASPRSHYESAADVPPSRINLSSTLFASSLVPFSTLVSLFLAFSVRFPVYT